MPHNLSEAISSGILCAIHSLDELATDLLMCSKRSLSRERDKTPRKCSRQLEALLGPSVSLTLARYTLLLWQLALPCWINKHFQQRSRHCVCSPSAHLKVFLQALSLNEGGRSFMQARSGSHSSMWLCFCTRGNGCIKAENAVFVLLDKSDLIKAGIKRSVR